jgi:type III secretory pathway component EscS
MLPLTAYLLGIPSILIPFWLSTLLSKPPIIARYVIGVVLNFRDPD